MVMSMDWRLYRGQTSNCCCILDMLSQHFGINMADCPELMKVYDGVVAEPIIKKWLEERPKTDH